MTSERRPSDAKHTCDVTPPGSSCDGCDVVRINGRAYVPADDFSVLRDQYDRHVARHIEEKRVLRAERDAARAEVLRLVAGGVAMPASNCSESPKGSP